jgi:hypothetical protein
MRRQACLLLALLPLALSLACARSEPPAFGWTPQTLRAFLERTFFQEDGRPTRLSALLSASKAARTVVLWVDFEGCRVYVKYFELLNEFQIRYPDLRVVGIVGRASHDMVRTLRQGNGWRLTMLADPTPEEADIPFVPRGHESFLLVMDSPSRRVVAVDWFLPLSRKEMGAFPCRLARLTRTPPPPECGEP